jgi:hypothetical protein
MSKTKKGCDFNDGREYLPPPIEENCYEKYLDNLRREGYG